MQTFFHSPANHGLTPDNETFITAAFVSKLKEQKPFL